MTPEQFCLWLSGYLDACADNAENLVFVQAEHQVVSVQERLSFVKATREPKQA